MTGVSVVRALTDRVVSITEARPIHIAPFTSKFAERLDARTSPSRRVANAYSHASEAPSRAGATAKLTR